MDTVDMNDITSIQLKKSTRDKIRNLGKKGESYDDVIDRLIAMASKAGEWGTGNED